MAKVFVIEQECLLSTEGRRASSNVDQYVVDGAVRAAHQLRLTSSGAAVHAPDHAPVRTRLGVLDKRCRGAGPAKMVVEDLSVECAGEQAAVIVKRPRGEQENIHEIGRFDTHMAMLS